MIETKTIKLDTILRDLRSFVVAFSGGVDSSFLVYRAQKLGKLNMTAVTIRTPYMPDREIIEAKEFADLHGIKHKIIELDIPGVVKHNPKDRCYLCKKILFSKITAFASENGFQYILDGTNSDDTHDIRPGLRALKELSVRSPLAEAGLTKNEIRGLLQKEGLSLWDKPAMACLLTRIPYDTEISEGMLRKIERAEDYLFECGYPGTRVRLHGDIARIECMPGFLTRIINDPHREQIVTTLKELGFRYISLDLEGYRTGSMNTETLEK
jgi:uncharacterized protein